MHTKQSQIVAAGYDEIADAYLHWTSTSTLRLRWLETLSASLPSCARILDLGCGAGVPLAPFLADRGHHIIGVDGSARQIELARRNELRAEFMVADMTTVEFNPASFDAVTAFYSITHVPRDLHLALLERIYGWLRPGSIFLASLGNDDTPSWTGEWLGTTMHFSHFDAATNRLLVEQAGFVVDRAEIIGEEEEARTVRFLWVVAHKPAER